MEDVPLKNKGVRARTRTPSADRDILNSKDNMGFLTANVDVRHGHTRVKSALTVMDRRSPERPTVKVSAVSALSLG